MKRVEYKCLCCQKVVEGDGFYTICPVCGWEADLSAREGVDAYCHVNHMTLREARARYAESGSVTRPPIVKCGSTLLH